MITNIILNLRSLVSAHCSPNPTYAVFTKQHTRMPLAWRYWKENRCAVHGPGAKKIVIGGSPHLARSWNSAGHELNI